MDNSLHLLLSRKELLKIVVSSLSETISKYTQASAKAGKPHFREGKPTEMPAVAGFIRFQSKDFSMVVFLGFSRDLFLALYSNMFQMETDEISAENADLAGEILNISFGIMDPKLRELGFELKSSLPNIYFNEKLQEVMKQIDSQALVIPYAAVGKNFSVEIYSADSVHQNWQFDHSAA